jgi:hypothetical protein
VSLQPAPAFEAIGSREHQLGVMQRKHCGVGIVVVGRDLCDSLCSPSNKRIQQFLRLTFELIEVGLLSETASGLDCSSHG